MRGLHHRLKWTHADTANSLFAFGITSPPNPVCELWLQIIGPEGGSGMGHLCFVYRVYILEKNQIK